MGIIPPFLRAIVIGLSMLALGACATADNPFGEGSIAQRAADKLVTVKAENRDLRICFAASGAVEVLTDLAQRGGNPTAALGNLWKLQNAVDMSRDMDSLWIETDSADVTLLFAAILKDSGKSRLAQIISGGPTISNFLDIAQRAIVITVKGRAVMKDINNILTAVDAGTLDKEVARKSCEDRMAMNRAVLNLLTGGRVSELDLIYPDGWQAAELDFINGPFDWSVQLAEYDFVEGNPRFDKSWGGEQASDGLTETVTRASTETFGRPSGGGGGIGAIDDSIIIDGGTGAIGDPDSGGIDGMHNIAKRTDAVGRNDEGGWNGPSPA